MYNKAGEINPNLHKLLSGRDQELIHQHVPRQSLSESIYCLLNNLIHLPICKQCGIDRVSMYYGSKKGYSDFCSLRCSRQHPDSKARRVATNLKKYGCKNPKQNSSVIEKTKKNNIEKYGVSSPAMTAEVKAKISTTLVATYTDRKDQILKLKEETFKSRYSEHPNRTAQVKNQKKKKTLEKYGVEHTTQLDSVKSLIKKTMMSKYGVEHYSKTDQFSQRQKTRLAAIAELSAEKFLEHIADVSTKDYTRQQLADLLKKPYSSLTRRVRELNISVKHQTSQIESSIVEYLKTLGITNLVQNDRSLLDGKEIDILLPDKQLAIEVNGVYWHSEKYGKDSAYHLKKTLACQENGIQLLHIFDTEWTNITKQEIWKGMIKSRLGLNKKIHARQCIVAELTTQQARNFCEINHLQGYVNGSVRLGLYDSSSTLIQVVVLGKPRYSKLTDFELLRSATVPGVTVTGGVSKLLSNVKGSIISYADRRYSAGNSYEKIGFTRLPPTPPNYFYVVGGQLQSRIQYQKHKLASQLDNFDPTLSEAANMNNNNFYRIWDCGNCVFVLDK